MAEQSERMLRYGVRRSPGTVGGVFDVRWPLITNSLNQFGNYTSFEKNRLGYLGICEGASPCCRVLKTRVCKTGHLYNNKINKHF